ncbi:DUF3515 domain-containing protein [Mycolicibacterium moriokaense]|nr:DUF3515 domain-containing protein [Mycolicibacterium moriokaense]
MIAVLVIAALRQPTEQARPVPLVGVPAPKATSPECDALMAALPDELGDYRRAQLADPAPDGAAAWQAGPDTDPVVLRCGVDRPAEFVVGVPTQVVDPVQWFQLADTDRSTWFAVDRPVYIALTLPSGSGPTPIQEISAVVSASMPARPADPAPAR